MGQRTPRLYRKASGIYWMRILVTPSSAPTVGTDVTERTLGNKRRHELRRSLRTSNVTTALRLSTYINAALAWGAPCDRRSTVDRLLAHLHNSTWTLPGGLSAADEDDQRRLEEFLARHPAAYEAAVENIRKGTTIVLSQAQTPTPTLDPAGAPAALPTGSPPQVLAHSRSADLPKAPIPMSVGMSRFAIRRAEGKKKRNPRTTADQVALVKKLVKHHAQVLGSDPGVHEFDTHHIGTFIDAEAQSTGKYRDEKGEPELVTASTLKKKLLDLGLFFSIMVEFQACLVNPVAGLNKRREDLAATANEEHESYLPFTKDHIAKIFEPSLYLSHNRDPDYFWCGLFAAHQGGRLAEYVLATPNDVAQDQHGIWYLAVRKKVAKNKNSVRRIPIPQPLLDLGFLAYVDHVRRLGATHLWPHRDLTSKTALRLPTKNQSDTFGRYLDRLHIVDPLLVFHSFRHTVVTALLDTGTPVHLSMQLCGHEAQTAAVARGLITEEEARSVHMTDYSHPDEDRLNSISPLALMRDALERSVRLPLDYTGLKVAAQIVLEHTRKVGDRFVTGWPAQRVKYTAAQLARLVPVANQSAIESPTINPAAPPSAQLGGLVT